MDIRANPTQTGFRNTPVAAPTVVHFYNVIIIYLPDIIAALAPSWNLHQSPCKKILCRVMMGSMSIIINNLYNIIYVILIQNIY